MGFSEPTKHVISLLSSGRCANPNCRISLLENFRLLGEFCHIEGEKEKSARYNPCQAITERNASQNGILLCSNCHTKIDNDPDKYTTSILNQWKKDDQNSPKLHDWTDRRIPLMNILSSIQPFFPIRPSSYLEEKSLFIGRTSEIKKISELVTSGTHVVSVVGEGGIGKTSVSTKAIRQIEGLFEIIISINITQNLTYREFLLEAARFANSSFINSLETEDVEALIREIFGNVGKILFFIDNYENVADFIDEGSNNEILSIHNFLETQPENVYILLNSRNRSNLEGETTVTISGLPTDDAVDLFRVMAKNYLQETLSEDVKSTIEDVCKMVDGHPLAIKLLGGSYRGGGIKRLREMQDELYSTIQTMRNSTERHRSIAACFNYSYSRLNSKIQNLILRLTLFQSYFTAESVREVFGIQEHVIIDLFQRTLLRRFPLLGKDGIEIFLYDFHPVIRNYLIRMRPKYFSFTPYEFGRYIKIYSKFVLTLSDTFFEDVSKNSKLIELLSGGENNDLWDAINGIPIKEQRSRFSNLLGLLLLQTGHKTRALRYHELCLRLDQDERNFDRIANDLTNIASCKSESAYSEDALSIRLTLAKDYEDKQLYKQAAIQYSSIGHINIIKGDYKIAESNFKKALSYFRKDNADENYIAETLMNLAAPLIESHKFQEAIDCTTESLQLYQKMGDESSTASANSNLSVSYYKRNGIGDLDKALSHVQTALKIDEREKNVRSVIRDYRIMSIIYLMMSDDIQASKYKKLEQEAISTLEKATGERFTDKKFSDFLIASDKMN